MKLRVMSLSVLALSIAVLPLRAMEEEKFLSKRLDAACEAPSALHEGAQDEFCLMPHSFYPLGKTALIEGVRTFHLGANLENVHTGLAEIFDEIPEDAAGIEALIHDQQALAYATKSCIFLRTQTTYPQLKSTYSEICSQSHPGAKNLAIGFARSTMQMLLYPYVCSTCDIRLPLENMGMACMGTDDVTCGKILACNKDIDVQPNKTPARGIALAYAYCLQKLSDTD